MKDSLKEGEGHQAQDASEAIRCLARGTSGKKTMIGSIDSITQIYNADVANGSRKERCVRLH